MPLALTRDQRRTLARVLQWSRGNGWTHDVYPNSWRSADSRAHVRYDGIDTALVVDQQTSDPLRCRVALVPVDSPDVAVDVLAALGHVPMELAPMAGRGLLVGLGDSETTDRRIRMTYRTLMTEDRHGYMSTYCQHGLHDDCKVSCKCCGAPCVCDGCLHVSPVTVSEPLPVMPSVDDEPDAFDGPASFIEAGQAFADWVDGRVSAEQAAEMLSRLARHGLIISVAYHDETSAAVAGGQGDLFDGYVGEIL